ncbi:MAG: NUDIX hydrolase [Candidatus Marsarchaeota archaeon]|jgi:ADP-ribose pyrophosphatase|nr:NUDIX hydrolase [Candidatus Marsarchaeota archaeon]
MKKILYKGKQFSVVEEDTKINNHKFKFIRFIEKNTVIILPIINNKIILERQYRPAIGNYIYELPAGHIENGEDPKTAAKRELKEETGYTAKNIKLMFESYPRIGTSDVISKYYIAKDLTKGKATPEKDEDIEIKLVPIENLIKMIKNNKIKDSKTVTAVLYYWLHMQ